MKIGITERGDAALNFMWCCKLDRMDGAILITKNITDEFIKRVLATTKPVIVHCTCTGMGGTIVEPNVPDYKTQLNQLKKLIDSGFPADRCVLRIDPIFPTPEGLKRVTDVLNTFYAMNIGVTRVRISVVDEYKHVKERFRKAGLTPIYGDKFRASKEQFRMVGATLSRFDTVFETCAEDCLANEYGKYFKATGCVGEEDLKQMGLEVPEHMGQNGQNRCECHCLTCKTELLDDKQPCGHGCLYCYWKDK